MADVLSGGTEPAAKRAKVAEAGLPEEACEFLRTEMLHLAAASGVLLGADGPFAHAPLSLLPYPFPSPLFAQATALATPFNMLVDRISRDLEWLCDQVRRVVAHDAFTRRLLEIAEAIKSEGAAQPLQLGVYRSDYMVHQPEEAATPRLLQVELNTISCSFVALGAKLTGLHRHLLPRCGAQGAASAALRAQPALMAALDEPERLPSNRSCVEIAAAIALAHETYLTRAANLEGWKGGATPRPGGTPVVLMLVQPNERNLIDQRGVEHQLWHAHRVPLRRATLAEVASCGHLDDVTKALRLRHDEVSVCYFRAGYTPADYPTEAEWQGRLLIERSFAVKCPSIGQHLAGTKKVQQVLAAPEMLARFVNPDQAAVLASCFAGLHGLDEEGGKAAAEIAVNAALDSPEAYVLKPQREGGGNNLYGEEMAQLLAEMPPAERASYILMERIIPPTHTLPLMRDGALDGGECIAELGVYGVFLGDGRQVLLNAQAGHLLRAKLAHVDEGGVCAGFAVLSSPVLFP